MEQSAERSPDGHPPTVSVVIPVKDDADELRECLRALALQSWPPDEIVVVDNGSGDGSALVAAEEGARVVRHVGGGIPAASAAGYDAARGEIIARVDADCRPDARWIEHVVRALDERPDAAAVTGGGRFDEGPRLLRGALAGLYFGGYYAVLTPTLGHVPLFGSNFAMRRAAWLAVASDVHRDDELVHDDLDLAFHLGRDHGIAFDRRLRMTVSIRPLTDPASYTLRVRRGFHTVLVHWPAEFPSQRWLRAARRGARAGGAAATAGRAQTHPAEEPTVQR